MDAIQRRQAETLEEVTDIQRRQAAVQRGQAEWLEGHEQRMEELERFRAEMLAGHRLHEQRMTRFDEKMLEIEEKLDALIRVVDGMHKRDGGS